MSDSIWFWEKEGKQHGPATEAEVKAKAASGEIQPDTLVWHEGMSDWTPLRKTKLHEESLDGKSKTPPPVPAGQATNTTGALTPVSASAAAPVRNAVLRENFEPKFRSSLGRAWELFKTDFWVFVGMFALMSILLGVAAQLYVTILFLMYPLLGGLSWYFLNRIRSNPVTIDALFFGFKRRFSDLAILNLVLITPFMLIVFLFTAVFIGLAITAAGSLESPEAVSEKFVAVGLIGGTLLFTLLLTIPYLAISAVANFAILLILDCDIPWKPAISMAWKAVKKHLFKFMAMMFLYTLLTQLGVIALYFGVFITGTWASLAMVYLYEDAFGDEPRHPQTL